MGWWKIAGTEATIGDGPLDLLGEAAISVVSVYETAFGRRPTMAEWESLLEAVLGTIESEKRTMDTGVVVKITVEARKG